MLDERRRAGLERNPRRVYAFQLFVNLSMWMPIWVVFLHHDRGLSLGQVYLVAGAGWVVQALAEVPTGALADAYGRRITLAVGCVTLAVGLTLLAVLGSFAGLLVAYLFWAAGNALVSGSDTALLYDSAVALGREREFGRMASVSFQVMLAAQAVGSIAGGLLGAIDLRIPILATVGSTVVAVVVLGRTTEPPRGSAPTGMGESAGMGESTGDGGLGWGATMRTAAGYVRGRPRLAALLAYAAMLSGTAFFVPFVLFQPAMQARGIAVGWLGVLFTGLRLAALAGSRYGPRLVSDGRLRGWLWLTPVLMAVGFVAVALGRVWWATFLAMLGIAAVNAAIRPALTALLNARVSGAVRATVNSLQNLVMTVFVALLHPAVGAVADAVSLAGAFGLLALVCLLPLAFAFPVGPLAASGPESGGSDGSDGSGGSDGSERASTDATIALASEHEFETGDGPA